MTNDAKRTARQQQGLDKWIAAKCRAGFEWCTGMGKTRLALMAIQQMNQRHPSRTTIVGVPGIDLKGQWEAEIDEWGLTGVMVLVDKTFIKMVDNSPVVCDLLILDELHNWGALNASRVFDGCKYRFLLGLTATIERTDQRHHIITRHAPIIDTITVADALKEGYISPFRVFNLGLEMDGADTGKYANLNKNFHKHFAVFGHDLQLAMGCMTDEGATAWAQQQKLEVADVKASAFQFNLNMAKRKEMLYGHSYKLEVARQLIKALPVPTITFSQTTQVPVQLQAMMPDISIDYGSHLKDKQRRINLARFNTDPSIRVIHTAKALDEGKDVKGLEMAIVLAATSAVRQNIQRAGRVLRKMPDKQALIINLYLKDTQDEKWLRDRQVGSINITWVNSVKQLLQKLGKTVHPVSDRPQLALV